jgi:threonine dehydratase
MALSWRSGSVVETDTIDTIADGVAGRCPIPEVLDDIVVVIDDVVLVSEESIKVGMRLLYRHAGLIVEPSAALGVAAVLEDRERFADRGWSRSSAGPTSRATTSSAGCSAPDHEATPSRFATDHSVSRLPDRRQTNPPQ